MPYSVDEKHSPSEFYYLGKTNDPNATFQGEDNAEQNSNKNSQEKAFSGLFYKFRKNCDSTKPYNKSLINLVCSVCTGKYCLRFLSHRPRSFVARSVRRPQAILSRTDLKVLNTRNHNPSLFFQPLCQHEALGVI